jgi:hypothetical protein
MYAAEMGDDATRQNLLEWVDNQYKPEWGEDGTFTYPVGPMDVPINLLPEFTKFANSTTIPLVAIARANKKNGMLDMHTKPFDGAITTYPKVENVDFNTMSLYRAIYDKEKECLVISTGKGPIKAEAGMINIVNLDTERVWVLKRNGREMERFEGVSSIAIDVPLDDKYNFVIAAE